MNYVLSTFHATLEDYSSRVVTDSGFSNTLLVININHLKLFEDYAPELRGYCKPMLIVVLFMIRLIFGLLALR